MKTLLPYPHSNQGFEEKKAGYFKHAFLIKKFLICLIVLFSAFVAAGQDVGDYQTKNDGGNWTSLSTWQIYKASGWRNATNADGYPGQYNSPGKVTIRNFTMDYVLNTSPQHPIGALEFSNGTRMTTLTFNDGMTLNVTGNVTINAPDYVMFGGDRNKSININRGTLNCSNIIINGSTSSNRTAFISLITGVINVTGDITMNQTNNTAYINFSDIPTYNGIINVGGTISGGPLTSNSATFNPPVSGTVNYNNHLNQDIGAYTYNFLKFSGGGIKNLNGNTTVNNILIYDAGKVIIGNHNLILKKNIQGSGFGVNKMIVTNGTGVLSNYTSNPKPILYPVGTGNYYTPFEINTVVYNLNNQYLGVRFHETDEMGSNFLAGYWEATTNVSPANKSITASFYYDGAQISSDPDDIWVREVGEEWESPTGTQSFGTNSFSIASTSDFSTTTTQWSASSEGSGAAHTLYSYQTGNWNNPVTWTTDPGGTTQVGNAVPAAGDVIVILPGRTVSLVSNVALSNLEINIQDGGILDMKGFSFSTTLKALKGKGTLRLSSPNFPSVTAGENMFVEAEGGITEYYNASNFNLSSTQTVYNHLHINNASSAITATLVSNLTLNGDLYIKQGSFRINDNTNNRRLRLRVLGNVKVNTGGSIVTGTGVTNSTTDPCAPVLEEQTINLSNPFIRYYAEQSHIIEIYGDFTNDGNVKFTNLSYPVFDKFPPTSIGTTTGFASVYLRGNGNNTLRCNGTTDFYNLIVDKGTDPSTSLTIYSTSYQNFRLFGANTAPGQGGTENPHLRKALWIRNGSLILKGMLVIPSLSEGTCSNTANTNPNSDFYVPAKGALVLDGSEVIVLSTADSYTEVNLAYGTSAPGDVAMGITKGGCSSFSIYGKLEINDGYFSTRESGGIINWDVAAGQLIINGGLLDAKQIRSAGSQSGLASYLQTGGTLELRGRLQRTSVSGPGNPSLLKSAPINTVREVNGINSDFATFNLENTLNTFSMSGGSIKIFDACGTNGLAIGINAALHNTNVTGGTITMNPLHGTGEANAAIHYINSTSAFYTLNVTKASTVTTTVQTSKTLVIKGDLNIQDYGVLNAAGNNIEIARHFTLGANGTYNCGINWTIFNGLNNQNFNINKSSPVSISKLKLDKPSQYSLNLVGTPNTLNVSDSLVILKSMFNIGTVQLNFSSTGNGYIYHSGIQTGDSDFIINGNNPVEITGDGKGEFASLQLNNTATGVAPVSMKANFRINDYLTFSQNKQLDIGTYNLRFGPTAIINNAGTLRFIRTAGNAGDGGVTREYSEESENSFTYPVGTTSTGHPSDAYYTPATLTLNGTPESYGSITVRPVGYEHPATTIKGRSLTYFWKVSSEGIELRDARLTHEYNYNDQDIVTGTGISEAGYVPARFDITTTSWSNGTTNDMDIDNNIIGNPNGSFLTETSFIDGDYTAGDNYPDNPFGQPEVYYSRNSGRWSFAGNWSRTGHNGNASTTVPGAGDIVIIGGNDSIWLSDELALPMNNSNPSSSFYSLNKAPVQAAILKIASGSVLDIQNNPGSTFGIVASHPDGNGKIRLTTRHPYYFDNPAFYLFPKGDFSDFNVNQGTTEFYTINPQAGTYYILPSEINAYGNVNLNPYRGSNIILPNIDYLKIDGNLVCNGSDADAWLAMTWDGIYGTIVPKTVEVKNNLIVSGGSFVFIENYTRQQNLTIHGNLEIAPGAGFYSWSNSTANKVSIKGNLINNSNNVEAPHETLSRFDVNRPGARAHIEFFGEGTNYITNTSNSPTTVLYTMTVNKGTSQSDSLIINIGGSLETPVNDWLTLQNGTLKYARANPSTDFTITTSTSFVIPPTAGLYVDYQTDGDERVILANNATESNDIFLHGKITLNEGVIWIGPTAVSTGNNNNTYNTDNDIEYSGGGYSEIEVNGGSLFVNGKIRSNTTATTGILKYRQTDGTVVVNGRGNQVTNSQFEVLNNSGSSFNMTGGAIYIVRGGSKVGDLYLSPNSSSVSGGDIIFGQSPPMVNAVNQEQEYSLYSKILLYNLTINGRPSYNATVRLTGNPLSLNGHLNINNSNSILDANENYNYNVSIKGDLVNNGTYRHQKNITTFNGSVQQVLGSSSPTFYNLNANSLTSLSFYQNTIVYNNVNMVRGTLLLNDIYVDIKGNVNNDANYEGNAAFGGFRLSGTNLQRIGGSGRFGRLELINSIGAYLESEITLHQNLKLTKGILDVNKSGIYLLGNSNIEGSNFGPAKMIKTDGVLSGNGVKKFFNEYTGTETTFTFPIGVTNKYTPVDFNYTSTGEGILLRVNNVNEKHPSALDPFRVLKYYWEVGEINSNITGNIVFHYLQEDVQGNEEDYLSAWLHRPGDYWSKIASVDINNNTITFNYSDASDTRGDYTAGYDADIPNVVPAYRSLSNGIWSDNQNWEQVGDDNFPCPEGGPNGFIVYVDHDITLDNNYASAYKTIITGKLIAPNATFGHNIGFVSGAGILYNEKGNIPAGRYEEFFSCSNNSILEFGGNNSYTLIADLYDQVSNLYFSGSGTKTLPPKDLTICKKLVINGPVLDNSQYNRTLFLLGTIERYGSGTFTCGSGKTATVSFSGTAPQTVGGVLGNFTGSNKFNNLEINNANGLIINTNGQVETGGLLLLTSGKITTTNTNVLTISNLLSNCVEPPGGTENSYVNGPLKKHIVQGDGFNYPIGKGNIFGNKLSTLASQSGTQVWTAEYFTPNPTYSQRATPLTYVNSQEYWRVSSTNGNSARIRIAWDPNSDLTAQMTENGLEDMRVAQFNPSSSLWEEKASSANGVPAAALNNGYVTSSDQISIPTAGFADFTTASVNITKPRVRFNNLAAVCGTDGIPLDFSSPFSIDLPYRIRYKKNGVLQAGYLTINSLPYTFVTLNENATYQLISFEYTISGAWKTGVADQTIINTYTQPTIANAGLDQSHCGASQTNLSGNTPVVGTGQWEIMEGSGGSITHPTSPNSIFNGVNGNAYTLKWVISNGGCISEDEVSIVFPLLANQPAEFTQGLNIACQGQENITYSVPNDPTVSYNWSYSGNGASITGTGHSVLLSFSNTATDGVLSVSASNDCNTSAPRTMNITLVPYGNRIWTGAQNNDWYNPANWSCLTCPTQDIAATIPSTALTWPVIAGGTAEMSNLTIQSGATISATNNAIINIYGNWINNGTFSAGQSTIVVRGTKEKTCGGTSVSSFSNLTINSQGGITLTSPISVNGTLRLTSGIVNTDMTNILTINSGANVSGGSNNSYISGPLKKNGNQPFVFPVGKLGHWARLGISVVQNATVNTSFIAEYFSEPAIYHSSAAYMGTGVHHVSGTEFWELTETSTDNPSCQVTLYWEDNEYSSISDPSDIIVAHYNTSTEKWETHGGAVNGGIPSGNVITTTMVSNFSPFTFGSKDGLNPLPVELLFFNAMTINKDVSLEWATASEINNAYFTIERSPDGRVFEALQEVPSKAPNGYSNNLLSYQEYDNKPLEGISYYRLKQTDYDGKSERSDIVAVQRFEGLDAEWLLFPNPNRGQEVNLFSKGLPPTESFEVKVLDIYGKQIFSTMVRSDEAGVIAQNILLPQKLIQGIYFVQVINPEEQQVIKMIVNQ